jgi:hypothetical protein
MGVERLNSSLHEKGNLECTMGFKPFILVLEWWEQMIVVLRL